MKSQYKTRNAASVHVRVERHQDLRADPLTGSYTKVDSQSTNVTISMYGVTPEFMARLESWLVAEEGRPKDVAADRSITQRSGSDIGPESSTGPGDVHRLSGGVPPPIRVDSGRPALPPPQPIPDADFEED